MKEGPSQEPIEDAQHSPATSAYSSVAWLTFLFSAGFLSVFVVTAIFDLAFLTQVVNNGFAWSIEWFGGYWQLLLLATFAIGLAIALSPYGRARLGDLPMPDNHRLKWLAMIMCTLLAGGGVFFAAAEPIAHYLSPPPLFDLSTPSEAAVHAALAQSFMHWGFLSWAILGSLTTIIFMYLHYEKGLPMKPRALLYPLLGRKLIEGWIGDVADAVCIIAVVAGTVGPIGFLGAQVSYGLEDLFGVPDKLSTQLLIILGLVALYTTSTVSGIRRGIQLLSIFNITLAIALMIFILTLGPTRFLMENYLSSGGVYLAHFFDMAAFREDQDWLGQWTLFFWGWFLGYGPMMAMFIARISNGRSIREVILSLSVLAPVVTSFWFTILGGTGLALEASSPGVISGPFAGFNMPGALLAITQQLPLGFMISLLFLILTTVFVATTSDSMTYTISMVMCGSDSPPRPMRVFWGLIMGALAAVLLGLGGGTITALQYFIIITAVPVSLLLLPSLWVAPMLARRLAIAQGVSR